jgi:hypothetical protein
LAALVFAFVPILLLVRRGSPIKGKSSLHTTTLVDSGLYGVVRHPQYLAYILFMLTFGLFAQRVFVTVLASLASGLLYLNAILEERDCAEKLGQGYQGYTEQVPRLNLVAGVIRRFRRETSLVGPLSNVGSAGAAHAVGGHCVCGKLHEWWQNRTGSPMTPPCCA